MATIGAWISLPIRLVSGHARADRSAAPRDRERRRPAAANNARYRFAALARARDCASLTKPSAAWPLLIFPLENGGKTESGRGARGEAKDRRERVRDSLSLSLARGGTDESADARDATEV